MRPILFVVFFTLGVGLMVVSGYVPKSASARGVRPGPVDAVTSHETGFSLYRHRPTSWAERSTTPATVAGYSPSSEVAELEHHNVDHEPNVVVADLPRNAVGERSDFGPSVAEELVPPEDEHAARFDDESDSATGPVADAGQDRVVWAGWDELKLNGSASEGDELTFDWLQVGGPRELNVEDARTARTRATGLEFESDPEWRDQVYEFELMVKDRSGEEAFDEVRFIVKAGPELTVSPRAQRRFEYRDGYLLAHYEAWESNLTTYESMFQVVSHTELAFTRVTGDEYDLVADRVDGLYVYRITVYGQEGAETSWLEFLIDTSERIPGILQLGVRWVSG